VLKILDRILWFVQAAALTIPPVHIPGIRKRAEHR
jgi:hypothetical protein